MKNFYTIKEWVGGKNKNKSVPLIILKTLVPLNILYNKRSKPIDF